MLVPKKSMNDKSLNRLWMSCKSFIIFIFLIILTESTVNPLNVDLENRSEIENVLDTDNMDENERETFFSKSTFSYVTTLFSTSGQEQLFDRLNFAAIKLLALTIDAPPPELRG